MGDGPAQPITMALVDASATMLVMASASTSTSVSHSMFSHVLVAATKPNANASAVAYKYAALCVSCVTQHSTSVHCVNIRAAAVNRSV